MYRQLSVTYPFQGETKVLASLSGPMEVRLAAEQASRATFEVLFRPLSGTPGALHARCHRCSP